MTSIRSRVWTLLSARPYQIFGVDGFRRSVSERATQHDSENLPRVSPRLVSSHLISLCGSTLLPSLSSTKAETPRSKLLLEREQRSRCVLVLM